MAFDRHCVLNSTGVSGCMYALQKENQPLPVSKENTVVGNDLWESHQISQHDVEIPCRKKRGHYFAVTSNVSFSNIVAFHLRQLSKGAHTGVQSAARRWVCHSICDWKCTVAAHNTFHSFAPVLLGLFSKRESTQTKRELPPSLPPTQPTHQHATKVENMIIEAFWFSIQELTLQM